MDGSAQTRARRARTLRGLVDLGSQMGAWLDTRRAADSRRQHASQLRALDTLLVGAVGTLTQAAGVSGEGTGGDSAGTLGEAFARCADLDKRGDWLRRVWRAYASKLDQRSDPAVASVLAAADELVWSAWRPLYEALPDLRWYPPPLPFLHDRYAPQAWPVLDVPPGLDRGAGPLSEVLREFPIPLVGVPRAVISEPWWLALCAHEVGHHVQFALAEGGAMVAGFRTRLAEAATAAGADAARWGAWSQEVFADVFSVASLGPWAGFAVAEYDLGPAAFVTRRRTRYPSPAVRLALHFEVWRQLSGEDAPEAARRGLDPATMVHGVPEAEADLKAVGPIVTAALAALPGLDVGIAELAGFDAGARDDRMSRARDVMCFDEPPSTIASVWAARHVAAVMLETWAQHLEDDSQKDHADPDAQDALDTDRDALRARGLEALVGCAPDGDRHDDAGVTSAAPDLGARCLAADLAELGTGGIMKPVMIYSPGDGKGKSRTDKGVDYTK